MAQTPEGKVKAKVVKLLKEYGVWYFFPASNGFGKAGIPDVVACFKGKFLSIECKSDASKKPTDLQVMRGKEIQQAGGVWMVVCDDATLSTLEFTIKTLQ
jgi:Holliday junction resolvase